jgi:phage tail-like protein
MQSEAGYIHLNTANAWPAVALSPTVVQTGGLLGLQQAGAVFATAGAFLAGPFQVSDAPTSWFRVQATLRTASNAHVQFFTLTTAAATAPWNPGSLTPFTDPTWIAAPRDARDFVVSNAPGLRFFLGCILRGDGTGSAQVEQIRLFFGRDTYAKFLPPVYRQQPAAADLLDRFLSMEQSVLSGIEQTIEDIPALFDPAASPAGDPPSWLGWLSGGLSYILDEHWTEPIARGNLAEAFELYGHRGTLEGLRRYLRIYAGVNAIIEEPSREAKIWSLGDAGPLGFSTMLAPGPLQGAVLNTTATADQSHLTTGESFGSALFEDVAHRFCVSVYCGELTSAGTLDNVRAVIDREKPAHTTYDLCVIEPTMRVGIQSRVGIDSIVASGAPPAGTGLQLGIGALATHAQVCRENTVPRPTVIPF